MLHVSLTEHRHFTQAVQLAGLHAGDEGFSVRYDVEFFQHSLDAHQPSEGRVVVGTGLWAERLERTNQQKPAASESGRMAWP